MKLLYLMDFAESPFSTGKSSDTATLIEGSVR